MHPFELGSATAAAFGFLALVLLYRNANSFQSPLEALLTNLFVFGYFPITLIVSPVIASIVVRLIYGNTRGMWRYFGGSAIVGFIFSALIVLTLLAAALASCISVC